MSISFSSRTTPRSFTWFDGWMATSATFILSIAVWDVDRLWDPKTTVSVLSGISANPLIQNHWCNFVIHSSSLSRPASQSELDTSMNSCISSAYCCCRIPWLLAIAAIGEMYNENKIGPSTDPWGTSALVLRIVERAWLIRTNNDDRQGRTISSQAQHQCHLR